MSPILSSAAEPANCSTTVLQLLETFRALAEGQGKTDSDLISTIEDAMIVTPACSPALIAAAVGVLDGEDDLIRRIVQSAIEIAPEHEAAIVQAARDASRTSDDVIVAASEGMTVPPDKLIPTSGGTITVEAAEPSSPEIPWISFPVRRLDEIGASSMVVDPAAAPFDVTVSLGAGFDSNSSTSSASVDSGFLQASLGAKIQRSLQDSLLEVSADYTLLDYFRGSPNLRQHNQLGGVGLRYRRGFGNRWTFYEEADLRRDTNPDFDSALTTAVREPAYHTIYNRVAAAFDVSPLWQLNGGYTINGINYIGGSTVELEDRLGHALGLESRHHFVGAVVFSASYEAEFVDFAHSPLDYTRHETLARVSAPLGEQMEAGLAAGAQFRRGGSGGSRATPAAEASLNWEPAEATRLRWVNRYGQFDHELALLGFDQREGYQTLLGADQDLTDRLGLHASAGLLATRFDGQADSLEENAFHARLGVSWELLGDVDLNAGYHFVQLDSPLEERDYIRHQFDLGLTHNF